MFRILSRKLLSIGLVAGLLLTSLAGCDLLSSDSNNTGELNVKMHDAPALFESVMVDIQQVEVNTGNGWEAVMEDSTRVDLLKLRNGTFEELGVVTLDAGTYNQIRLILGSDNTVTIDGETFNLKTPSAQQTGIKLNVDFEIDSEATTNLLLDFDAKRSVVKAGAPANPSVKYLLKPVIRASVAEITGNIKGTISPVEANPWVYAIHDSDTVATTLADSTSGEFQLTGLSTQSFDVAINPTDTTYSDTTITDVKVEANETTELNTVTLTKVQ